MTARKKLLLISFIVVLLSCNNEVKKTEPGTGDSPAAAIKPVPTSRFIYSFADSILEARITDTLMKLSFVQKTNSYIDSFSHHQHGIAFMPDTSGNNISVAAGYNGPDRFETYYNFSIDRRTLEIKIIDPVSGDYLSIDEYIKRNKEQN